ncbi:transmembrane protein 132C isoform X2 [Xiphias gladius]|nr:transmembrane protein 132C isoform X2 [Xiphias gladius]
MGVQRVLQVDLKMESFPEPLGSRWMAWQVEYPVSRATTQEAETEIRLAQEDLAGIVPLAMDSEILNTAVLTGKTVAVPVKVVTIGIDTTVTDVSEAVKCRSTDEDVVKVSDRCDYVFVNGKEMKGKVKMMVNFTYGYLSAQLELNVWIPRLPLQIEVSDTELSQIKGWRVPIMVTSQRSTRESEDEDDEDRRGRSCTLQYQHAMVRVLTHFVAESADPRGQTSFMLGTDWQVDITELVWDFLKVEDPQIAQLLDRRILMGLDIGMTTIQVLSPLSDSILAEKTVTVVDDKVTITELGVQLVTGLSMNLQLSPGSNRAILATTTTQEVLQSPKQEALISAWLQFSDGSVAPLDLYNPDFFVLTATSLDEEVVTVQQDPSWKWPVIVTEAEGQGLLVRVEMTVCEVCQKFKRRSVLAAGNCNVRVKFGHSDSSRGGGSDYGPDGDDIENKGRLSPSQDRTRLNTHYYGSSISDMEDGVLRRATTTRSAIMRRPNGGKLSDDGSQNMPIDFADFPAQVDLPRGRNMDDDLIQTARGLTDLEIGMYALLGVFCLAILVFLINCISYTLKYRHKELSIEGQENMNHAHDWVWLGNEAELLESQISLSPQQEEQTSMMDSSSGLEEGSHLLNGGSAQKNVHGQVHRMADTGCIAKDSKGDSPTTKRKRVKFTTFTTIPSDNSYPTVNTLTGSHNQDIKWVCQDVELGDSKELRNYMERLNDSALKEVA